MAASVKEIRVLYLTNNPNRGSTARPVAGWFTYLRARGLKPVLASDRSGGFQSWATEQEVPCEEIALPFPNKFNPLPILTSLWRLRRLVKTHRIQLIHCVEHNVFPIAKYLSRLSQVPVITSVQYTVDRPFCSWAFAGNPKPSRLLFVSKGNLEACRGAVDGLVDQHAWKVVYNSVDTAEFTADAERGARFKQRHNLQGKTIVGTASALRPRKQIEHMIEAARRLSASGSHDFIFVLAGGVMPGDETYGAELLKHAEHLLGAQFRYLGYLEDLRDFYNALDLYLHTSKEEGCSLSIFEAMSCGCPVVGYRSIAGDEQILPDAGEIVDQDNVDKLTTALARWVANPNLREQTGENARAKVVREFSSEVTSEVLWEVYLSVLDEVGSTRNI